jgi:hypothetical protein
MRDVRHGVWSARESLRTRTLSHKA